MACHEENKTDIETTEIKKLLPTDTIFSENFGLEIRMNTLGIFDTSYNCVESSCMFVNYGIKFANTEYENVPQFSLDWYKIESDSLLNMTIFLDNNYKIEIANQNYTKSYYEKNQITRKAQGKSQTEPLFINSEKIGTHQVTYICYADSLELEKGLYTNLSLSAVTFLDSTQIDIHFTCLARDCSGKDEIFMKILRSLEVENSR